jgi:hypothetical protein
MVARMQVAALEEAILASLDVVGRLLRPLNTPGDHTDEHEPATPHAPCTLERLLLAGAGEAPGGVAPAAALASYVSTHRTHAVDCRELSSQCRGS